jgi:hypothetical protein
MAPKFRTTAADRRPPRRRRHMTRPRDSLDDIAHTRDAGS